MARAEDYRRYAAECVRIARETHNPQEKATLIKMAEKWRQLAEKAQAEAEKAEAEKAEHKRRPEEAD